MASGGFRTHPELFQQGGRREEGVGRQKVSAETPRGFGPAHLGEKDGVFKEEGGNSQAQGNHA